MNFGRQCQVLDCADQARYVWALAIGEPGPVLDRVVRLCGTCSKRSALLGMYAHQFLGWVER